MEKLEPSHYEWECKMGRLLWKTVWQVLKKLNIELLYDPESLLLSIYLRELKTHIHTET